MFRSQADPCYPENGRPDGCYPDNAPLPSRFMCWVVESVDRAAARGDDTAKTKAPKGSKGSRR